MADQLSERYVRGGEKLRRRIGTITAALALPVLTNEVGKHLLRRNLERFDKEVDPDGNKWEDLKSTTLQRRNRAGTGSKILNRTGELRAAIRLIKGGADSVYINTGAGVRIGVDDPDQFKKARAHQRGYGKIPQRRFLGVSKLDVASVDALLRRRALTALEG